VNRPKSSAEKNIDIDIANILGSEISVNIDIGKGDINPALSQTIDIELRVGRSNVDFVRLSL